MPTTGAGETPKTLKDSINKDGNLTKEELSTMRDAENKFNMSIKTGEEVQKEIEDIPGSNIKNFLGTLELENNPSLTAQQLEEKLGGNKESIALLQLYLKIGGFYVGKIDGYVASKSGTSMTLEAVKKYSETGSTREIEQTIQQGVKDIQDGKSIDLTNSNKPQAEVKGSISKGTPVASLDGLDATLNPFSS